MSLPRNDLLSLEHWRDYEVDSLSVGGVEIPRALRERFIEHQVGPFREKRRQAGLSETASDSPNEPKPEARVLACVLDGGYPQTAMAFGHYDAATRRNRSYLRYEQLLDQLDPTWPSEMNILLLVRAVTGPTPEVARRVAAERVPSGYYLDDDLLHLHEYGPSFEHLAPGQPFYTNLVAALGLADAVWTTSPAIEDSVRPHNPRIVPHNGAVPEAWLPDRLRPRGSSGRIRIAHAGGSYRIEEFQEIWEGLRRIAREFSEAVEFRFFGVDVSGLPPLDAPVSQAPYVHSYDAFMNDLRSSGVDILLSPLLDRPRPRLAKSPCKYYDTAAAGAFGIFSDVTPYAVLPHGLTCLKAVNTAEAWHEAIRQALVMPEERFDAMRRRLIEHVRLEYTETSQLALHEAACRATEFHAMTREHRHSDGRPRVLLLPTIDRESALELRNLFRRYAIEPVAAPREDGMGHAKLDELLIREGPAVAVAPLEPAPAWSVCADRGVRCVLGMPDALVSPDRFRRGLLRLLRDIAPETTKRSPVVAIHKGVFTAGSVRADLETSAIRWVDYEESVDLSEVDILVVPAAAQALVAAAAAEGVLLVCAAGDAIPFPVDGVSGIVSPDATAAVAESLRRASDLSSEDRLVLRTAAYQAARVRSHPDAVANELFRRFVRVLQKERCTEPAAPQALPSSSFVRPPEPPAVRRLKDGLKRARLYRPLSRLLWHTRRRRVLVAYEHLFVSERLYYGQVLDELAEATGRQWLFLPASEIDPSFLYSFHTVISMRGTSEKSLDILRMARRSGCRTIYDTDDNLLLLSQAIADPENEWRRTFDPAKDRLEAMLASADVVRVYSRAAIPIFLPHNPNVVAIPPYQLVTRSDLPAPRRGGPVTVGFLGSRYKDEEFGALIPALERLLCEPRRFRLEIFGFGPAVLTGREDVTTLPWERDYRTYREKLDSFGWDIGLAPLRDLEFHRCKASAKYLEYAASGIAGIYSDARIYRDAVAHRKTGLLVRHDETQAWYDAIVELAEDASLRSAIAARALEDVRRNYRREDYVTRVANLVESPPTRRD
jgi:glycosyltransferase involved in cell wall biosynthesis